MNPTADQLATHWQMTCAATVRHAITLLRLAGHPATGKAIMQIVRSAPHSKEQADDPHFPEQSCCWKDLGLAFKHLTDRPGDHEGWAAHHDAEAHLTQVLPALGPAACELLVQSVAGVVLGLCGMESDIAPPQAWPPITKPDPESGRDQS